MDQQPPALGRRSLFKASLGAATVAVVGGELATPECSRPRRPDADSSWIIGCDDWGARPPAYPLSVSSNTTNKIIVHHMAFPNSHGLLPRSTPCNSPGTARTCTWTTTAGPTPVSTSRSAAAATCGGPARQPGHPQGRRAPDGRGALPRRERQRDRDRERGHLRHRDPATGAGQLVDQAVRAVCQQYGLHAYDIFGHWDFRATDCPGAAFYRSSRPCAAASRPGSAKTPATRRPDAGPTSGVSSADPSCRSRSTCLKLRGYTVTPRWHLR